MAGDASTEAGAEQRQTTYICFISQGVHLQKLLTSSALIFWHKHLEQHMGGGEWLPTHRVMEMLSKVEGRWQLFLWE